MQSVIKSQANRSRTLLKRDSGICAFLKISLKFQEYLFCRMPTDCYFSNIFENENRSTGFILSMMRKF